jgi:hypothetical protein
MPRNYSAKGVVFSAIWVVAAAMSVLAIIGLVTYPGPPWIYSVLMGSWVTFISLLFLYDHYAEKGMDKA